MHFGKFRNFDKLNNSRKFGKFGNFGNFTNLEYNWYLVKIIIKYYHWLLKSMNDYPILINTCK